MSQTISLLLAYKYYILFPLAIFEGPILAIIAGFFVSTGFLSIIPVYLIVVAGDVLGDMILYLIGKLGVKSVLIRFGRFFNTTPEKLDQAKEYFNLHQRKALIFSKLVHGIGIAGLIAAGSIQVPYWRFFRVCLTVSLIQSAIIVALGIFFGGAYIQLSQYLNYYSAGTIIVAMGIILFIIFRKLKIKFKP